MHRSLVHRFMIFLALLAQLDTGDGVGPCPGSAPDGGGLRPPQPRWQLAVVGTSKRSLLPSLMHNVLGHGLRGIAHARHGSIAVWRGSGFSPAFPWLHPPRPVSNNSDRVRSAGGGDTHVTDTTKPALARAAEQPGSARESEREAAKEQGRPGDAGGAHVRVAFSIPSQGGTALRTRLPHR